MAAGLLGLAGSAAFVGPQAAAADTVSPLPASNYGVRPVCGAPAPGHAACLALELVPESAAARARSHPLGTTRSLPANAGSSAEPCHPREPTDCFGLRPQDLHSAYQLPSSAESAQTIAIVDPFNDPSAEADLKEYDREFGLPECTAQDGCFQQVNERGEAGKLPFPSSVTERATWEALCKPPTRNAKCGELQEAIQWDSEISLDVETAHGVCQNCHILLVEAASAAYPNLEEAEESAVRLGATEISDSWGEPERDFGREVFARQAFNHPGIVITAAAGDEGYAERGVDYPASSPHVVAVGGTRLSLNEGAWKEETVWNGQGATGSGCSEVFAASPWQLNTPDWSSVGCGEKRAVSDVSADADPNTGAAIYNSDSSGPNCEGHWCTLGGTSLASPLIAGVFALAGGAHGVEYPARTLYENQLDSPGSLHDIVAGSNGACSQQAICLARVGYDGPSGVGTPNGIAAFEPPFARGGGPAPPPEPTSNNDAGLRTQQSGSASAGAPASPTGSIHPLTVTISGLALTPRAVAALDRAERGPSQIRFTFSINAAAHVRATVAKRVRIRGRQRWKLLRASLTIAATRGRNSGSLRVHSRLDPGSYRLTLTAAHGNSRSIFFRIG